MMMSALACGRTAGLLVSWLVLSGEMQTGCKLTDVGPQFPCPSPQAMSEPI
jgi:hypothetical protein